MARRFAVQHFVACVRATVAQPAPDNPYTLHDVGYYQDVRPEQEWPVRLDGLAVYARFHNPRPIDEFTIQVVWIDAPGGRQLIWEYRDLMVRGRPGLPVQSWVWGLAVTRFPGPGRYALRLHRPGRRAPLARDYLFIRRLP